MKDSALLTYLPIARALKIPSWHYDYEILLQTSFANVAKKSQVQATNVRPLTMAFKRMHNSIIFSIENYFTNNHILCQLHVCKLSHFS